MTLWNQSVDPDLEPLQIFIEKGSWTDARRQNRIIPYKIYKPEKAEHCPVIVWSHGLGGSRDGAGFISRYVASYGYIVVHIQHAGTDSSLWEGKPGHPWDIVRATHIPRKATLQRFQDVPFALHEMQKMFGGEADMARLGFCGHSFGAMTAQVMAGQYRGYGRHRYSLYEPRIKAGILYSPVPVRKKHGRPPGEFYGGIRIPLLTMTGTEDHSPLGDIDAKQRREVFDYFGGPDQHLLILQDGDHMIFNGSRGQLGSNPKRAAHERIIKVLSLAFWDAYLKNDRAALDWLTGEGVRNWLGVEAAYVYRAFPEAQA
jgi:dienelactone hydrolase